MPTYSFGVDSPLKFELDEDYAAAYNRATMAFFEAQHLHRMKTGTQWDPSHPLYVECSKEDIAAFNAFGKILEDALERYGKAVTEDEITDDFLVKN
jgi:hypothetical protein